MIRLTLTLKMSKQQWLAMLATVGLVETARAVEPIPTPPKFIPVQDSSEHPLGSAYVGERRNTNGENLFQDVDHKQKVLIHRE